jgi:hypothetical protein
MEACPEKDGLSDCYLWIAVKVFGDTGLKCKAS